MTRVSSGLRSKCQDVDVVFRFCYIPALSGGSPHGPSLWPHPSDLMQVEKCTKNNNSTQDLLRDLKTCPCDWLRQPLQLAWCQEIGIRFVRVLDTGLGTRLEAPQSVMKRRSEKHVILSLQGCQQGAIGS